MKFISFNVVNYHLDTISSIIPDLYLRSKYYQYPFNFSFDQESMILLFNTFTSFQDKKSKNIYEHNYFIANDFPVTNLYKINNEIIFANSYKDASIQSNWFYSMKYDLESERFKKILFPDFENIEFSYFDPNNWIDFHEEILVMSQTNKYEISVFDSDFELKNLLKRDSIIDWKPFAPTSLFDTAKIYSQPNEFGIVNPSSVMEYLNRHINKISRIEYTYLISDSLLAVFYYNSQNNIPIRKVDIWNIHSGEMKYKDLLFKDFENEKVIDKFEFPIFFDDSDFIFIPSLKKLVLFRLGGNVKKYLNVSYEDFLRQENDYLLKNELSLQIYIFDCNF